MGEPVKNSGAEKTKHKADQHALAVAPALKAAVAAGANGLKAIAARLNENNVPTQRGGKWQPGSVQRLQNRLAALDDTTPRIRSRSEAQTARHDARRARDRAARAANAKRRQGMIAAGIIKV